MIGALFKFLFILWGILGFVIGLHDLAGMTGNVSVATLTYVAVAMLLWIGGMFLFGIGGLLWTAKSEV
jgi:hypothetical protein